MMSRYDPRIRPAPSASRGRPAKRIGALRFFLALALLGIVGVVLWAVAPIGAGRVVQNIKATVGAVLSPAPRVYHDPPGAISLCPPPRHMTRDGCQ